MISSTQAPAVYRKEEKESQQLVALPNPIRNSALIEGTLSWTERLLFTLAGAEVIDPAKVMNLKETLPAPLVKMLTCIDSLFVSRNVQDEEESGSSLILLGMSDAVQQLIAQKRAFFVQAGVRSQAEFDAKAATLSRYKEEALHEYIANPVNIALRKMIDEQVVRTATGELSTRTQRTLNVYWELISRYPSHYDPHAGTVIATMKVAFEAMPAIQDKMQESSFRAHMGRELENIYSKAAEKAAQELVKAAENAKSDEERVVWSYQLLKASCYKTALLHIFLKMHLQPQLEKAERVVRGWQDFLRDQVRRHIAMDEEWLADDFYTTDPEKLRTQYRSEWLHQERLENNIKYHEELQKRIAENRSRQDFRREAIELALANGTGNCDPDEVRSTLAKATASDRTLMQVLALEGIDFDRFARGPFENKLEVEMCLNWEYGDDPLTYFKVRYALLDQQIMQLLLEKSDSQHH